MKNSCRRAIQAEKNYSKHKIRTLRNVDKRPGSEFPKAYMHKGVSTSLKEVVHFHNTQSVDVWPEPEATDNVNRHERGDIGLTDNEAWAVAEFLKTLSDGYDIEKAGQRTN